MSTEPPCHFGHLLQILKTNAWSLIFYIFFMVLYMYIAPEQWQTTPCGQNFDVNRNLSLRSFITSIKKSPWNLILYTFLMILYMYIAPGQRQTTPWGQNFDVNRKALSLCPFVASFKQISLNSNFIHIYIFQAFIHVYSPGAGADNPLGTKLGCQQMSLRSFVVSFFR